MMDFEFYISPSGTTQINNDSGIVVLWVPVPE